MNTAQAINRSTSAGATSAQLGLAFAPTLAQQFEAWKATPGGGHVMSHFYRLTANTGHAADSQTIFDTADGKQWVII